MRVARPAGWPPHLWGAVGDVHPLHSGHGKHQRLPSARFGLHNQVCAHARQRQRRLLHRRRPPEAGVPQGLLDVGRQQEASKGLGARQHVQGTPLHACGNAAARWACLKATDVQGRCLHGVWV